MRASTALVFGRARSSELTVTVDLLDLLEPAEEDLEEDDTILVVTGLLLNLIFDIGVP